MKQLITTTCVLLLQVHASDNAVYNVDYIQHNCVEEELYNKYTTYSDTKLINTFKNKVVKNFDDMPSYICENFFEIIKYNAGRELLLTLTAKMASMKCSVKSLKKQYSLIKSAENNSQQTARLIVAILAKFDNRLYSKCNTKYIIKCIKENFLNKDQQISINNIVITGKDFKNLLKNPIVFNKNVHDEHIQMDKIPWLQQETHTLKFLIKNLLNINEQNLNKYKISFAIGNNRYNTDNIIYISDNNNITYPALCDITKNNNQEIKNLNVSIDEALYHELIHYLHVVFLSNTSCTKSNNGIYKFPMPHAYYKYHKFLNKFCRKSSHQAEEVYTITGILFLENTNTIAYLKLNENAYRLDKGRQIMVSHNRVFNEKLSKWFLNHIKTLYGNLNLDSDNFYARLK